LDSAKWEYDLITQEFSLEKEWKKKLGFKDNEKVCYLDYLSLIPDELRYDQHKALQNIIENEAKKSDSVEFDLIYKLITKDNQELIVRDHGEIFFNEEQTPVKITGTHIDITE